MFDKVLLGAIALIVIAGGVYAYTKSQDDTMKEEEGSMMKQDIDAMDEAGDMEKDMDADDADMDMKKDSMKDGMEEDSMMKGSYEAYAPEKLARAEDGDVVLFFKATWCPTCKALDADLEAQRDAIPSGLSILEVDYDTQTALKEKYGVTVQHTLVQVDAQGEMITKWSGGLTLATVLQHIQ